MIDRREFLIACAGIAAAPTAPLARRPQRSLIVIWLDGGMSHIDTFDGKPEASPGIRGDLRTRAGAIEGTFVSEHLPRIAERLDRCALLRSISHGDGNHDRGTHLLLTGERLSPVLEYPSFGAVRASLRDAKADARMPSYVAIPAPPAFGGSGFLPAEHGPFTIEGEPHRPNFRVRNLTPRAGAERGLDLLTTVDALGPAARSASEQARDRLVERAVAMGRDNEIRQRFALDSEPSEVRASFGRHALGQSCLLALKLAAGGTDTIVVRDRGWDMHRGISRALTVGFPPKLQALDESVGALLDTLRDRGLEDRVTVCVASEFGRTPRLNPAGGRDHWPRAQSVLLAGAGIRPGVVFGATDPRGEEPIDDARSPADLLATLLTATGVDTSHVLHTRDGRPIPIVPRGSRAIGEVLIG